MFRLSLLFLALIASTLLVFGFYFQRRLAPVMEVPESGLMATPIHFTAPANLRTIDLGYARCSVPATFTGKPAQLDDTVCLALDTGVRPFPIFFNNPVSDRDPDVRALIENASHQLDENIPSYFEFKKRVFATRPFLVWSIPFRGVARSKAEFQLLAIKIGYLDEATDVRLYETPHLSAIIIQKPKVTIAEITDHLRGIHQSLFVSRDVPHADELIAAVVTSYTFTAPDPTEASLHQALKTAGIPSLRTSP